MLKGAAKVELSAIIVNIKIEPLELSGFICILGGKKNKFEFYKYI